MADTYSTTSTLDNLLPTYFERVGLARAVPKAILYAFADKTNLPKGSGKTVRWNAWSNFAPISATYTEGAVTPVLSQSLSSRKVEATLVQAMRGVKDTDLIDYTSSLDVLQGTVENLGDSAGRSVDYIIQMKIFKNYLAQNRGTRILSSWMSVATASAFHPGSNNIIASYAWGFPVVWGTTAAYLSSVGKTAPSTSALFGPYAIRKAVKQLRWKNASEFADGTFKAITNTNAIQDMLSNDEFRQWYKYTTPRPMEQGVGPGQGPQEIATVEGCKIYASNNMPWYRATGHSCDLTFIFGQGAYGVTSIGAGNGKGFSIIIKRPGPQDTSNPMDLYGTISYKITMAAAALNVSSGRILITHCKP